MSLPQYRSALCLLLVSACTHAAADDKVMREHQFNLDDIDTVELHGSVGSIDIVPASGNALEVVLRIEGKDDGWFSGTRDVSQVDLEQRVRHGHLILEQTEEDTETHWLVRLPSVGNTEVHLGVGSIKADLPFTTVDVHVGVGEVVIDYPGQAAGEVRLKVGVGEASIRGEADISSRRAFVSQEVNASGAGDQDIDVNVGVGNIDLHLL